MVLLSSNQEAGWIRAERGANRSVAVAEGGGNDSEFPRT
jgi:hypothetical protein